jgi:hypothetical protein
VAPNQRFNRTSVLKEHFVSTKALCHQAKNFKHKPLRYATIGAD